MSKGKEIIEERRGRSEREVERGRAKVERNITLNKAAEQTVLSKFLSANPSILLDA